MSIEDDLMTGRFEDLPIQITKLERKDGWFRHVPCPGTIADLLDTWDIDNPNEQAEIAQVLRLLRTLMEMREGRP